MRELRTLNHERAPNALCTAKEYQLVFDAIPIRREPDLVGIEIAVTGNDQVAGNAVILNTGISEHMVPVVEGSQETKLYRC